MAEERRDNKLSIFTPFSARWNSAPILFRCKNCKHEYLIDIAVRGYTFMDIVMKRSENYKKFWNNEFKCPKCKTYTPPIVLILEPNSNKDTWKQKELTDFIKTDDKKWRNASKDNSKMLILDDYRMLLPMTIPISRKAKKLLSKLNKYNSGIEIKFIKNKK